MHVQLAWRTVWRNPRRTMIILSAVIIGAWAMILFGALSRGMMTSMLSTSLNTLTGHIQIQKPQYREDPVVDHRISDPASLESVLNANLPPGARWTLRIQVDGVASNARHSQGIVIVGIDPEKETAISFYGNDMWQGRLLNRNDAHGIVIGKALAEAFETKPGRKLVVMSQGADGQTASGALKILGIYRAEMPATEKRYVFVTLPAARTLLGIEDKAVTSACIKLSDLDGVDRVVQTIGSKLPDNLVALSWKDLLPLLNGYLGVFDGFMLLWYLVVFVAMAFGLVNTMLMAVLERTREFGLLKALGMKPYWIVRGVLTESLMILAVGLLAGNLVGMATVQAFSGGIDLGFLSKGSEYFGMGRVIVPFLTPKDMLAVNAVILVLGLIVCLYPAIKAGRIAPVEAMAQT